MCNNYILHAFIRKSDGFLRRPVFRLICAAATPRTAPAVLTVLTVIITVSVIRRSRIPIAAATVYNSSVYRKKTESVRVAIGIPVGIARSSIARRSATTARTRLCGITTALIYANISASITTNRLRCSATTATVEAEPRITRIAHNYIVSFLCI